MNILAIETSCDDTAVAILEIKKGKLKPLSNVVSSQEIHQNYGGVFPMMAKREHQRNLVPVLLKALKESKLLKTQSSKRKTQNYNSKLKVIGKILEKEQELLPRLLEFLEKYEKPEIDVIAVTNGPGLEPCLWVGVNFARVLSYVWDIPLIPVNHIEGHILVNFIDLNSKLKAQNSKLFPALALVVSGNHTQLILVKKVGKYEIIGETRDDAAGECFDKCARLLGLGYPGGSIISKIASGVKESNIKLPRPMIGSKDYDFSFSGLKTAVLYTVRENKLTDEFIKEMSFEVQQAIIDVLLKKTMAAARQYNVRTIILGGGVSANKELRKQMKRQAARYNLPVLVPDPKLSTDNALMIAVVVALGRSKKIGWNKLSAEANLRVG